MSTGPTQLYLPLERLLTSENGFGLTTASPLQRAVCRIIDGVKLRELAAHEEVATALGGAQALAALPTVRPTEVVLLSGIRCAKSMIAAAMAIRASQTVPIEHLSPGEIPRVPVVSLTLDLAQVVFRHIVGTMQARPALARLLLEKPTTDSVLVRHPCGRPVEIKVTPLSSAGSSLVARWLLGVIFDEAPRMAGADDGVRNLTDARSAAIGRILPGGQVITIGSPWAPFGPVYELVQEHFGKPSERIVIIRGTGPAMNSVWWSPERCERLKQSDPMAYRTDVLGEFCDPESSLFSSTELEKVTRTSAAELPREAGLEYCAAMDPGTRGNSWTLVVMTRRRIDALRTKQVLVMVKQWTGSKVEPLSPERVLEQIATICKSYGIDVVSSDQYAADALRDIADRFGLALQIETITASRKVDLYQNLQATIAQEEIELSPDPVLRADLLSVRKRVTQNGISIELPRTADGRHADYAAALVLAAARHVDAPSSESPRPLFGTAAYWQWFNSAEQVRARQDAQTEKEDEDLRREEQRAWWDSADAAANW